MREDNLAGKYYQNAPTLLNQQMEQIFNHEKGPGSNPVGHLDGEPIKGIIVPRFDYDTAGPCAAWSYKALGERTNADVYILVSQSNDDYTYVTDEPFKTPYGIVRVDQTINRQLLNRDTVKQNDAAFDNDEHIRSQLPLLQYSLAQNEKLKILPIQVSAKTNLKKLSIDIKEACLDDDKDNATIIPTNLTKYGPRHTYVPFSQDPVNQVAELDKGLIEQIKQANPKQVLSYYEEHSMNTENIIAILFGLIHTEPAEVLLEQYYGTNEFTDDQKNFITFASMILR